LRRPKHSKIEVVAPKEEEEEEIINLLSGACILKYIRHAQRIRQW
jgi:hypothetical protein